MASKQHHLHPINGFWYYRRRVPKAVLSLLAPGTKPIVKLSTGIHVIDDPDGIRATKTAVKFDEAQERDWALRVEGRTDEASHLTVASIARAKVHGYRYRPADEVAGLPLNEVLGRIEALMRNGTINQKIDRTALLGGVSKSSVLLNKAAASYNEFLRADHNGKSPNQLLKAEKKKEAAMRRFIAVVGDKDLLAVSREDALAFRKWWSDRIENEDITSELAIKDIQDVRMIIATIIDRDGLHAFDQKAFDGIKNFKRQNNQREAWPLETVRDVILATDPADLEAICHDIMLVVIGTGARPSEVVALQPHHIHLKHNIPHIEIAAEGREVKTANAKRKIPLTGIALEAMRRNSQGFERYNDRAAVACAKINAWLRQFQPEPEEGDVYKTVYCFRHTFANRLYEVHATDKMRISLMGHEGTGPKYGEVPLSAKAEIMAQIAF
ncbi:tyrosine-type recombinase/integrase [Bradyrhizobium septentrionale]|uniref:tyrosine-type recombinase/integrase n=1 Tax=Bradyrhizobium septentrionale TaxID=1404411 RepID=UPI001596FFF8|nr:tyrosine-type recombinase/integrase [Bradyrhizobium septentrionale]UGY28174.1 tyrosine-type recombinase/integrase [Bradyrhizobium septentrionale]